MLDDVAVVPRGHLYQNTRVRGQARVHMGDHYGDQTTNINNYVDLFAAMDMQRFQDAGCEQKAAIVQLAVSIIAVAIVHTLAQYLRLLSGRIHRAAPYILQRRVPLLLNSIGYKIAIFEDAFGEIKHIDLDVITSWTDFHYDLTCAFKDKAGYRRVAVAGYRLFESTQGRQIIDPKYPPPFAKIFRPKAHVLMSVHFGWEEVPVECCPKCGLEQTCELDWETACKNKQRGFYYRGQVEECRIQEIDDETMPEERATTYNDRKFAESARKELLKDEREHPGRFKRISVSKQPPTLDFHDEPSMPATQAMASFEPLLHQHGLDDPVPTSDFDMTSDEAYIRSMAFDVSMPESGFVLDAVAPLFTGRPSPSKALEVTSYCLGSTGTEEPPVHKCLAPGCGWIFETKADLR